MDVASPLKATGRADESLPEPRPVARNPYDEFPYRSRPIPWTAPEHLALASMLHGGPRACLDAYSVLELGCGDGANLLALAFYRRHARFVGVDSSAQAIGEAEIRRSQLGLTNIRFIEADFRRAATLIEGTFDFVLGHGVFSWLPLHDRGELLALCAGALAPSGLLYLNYNSKPGWNVRGMVRDFLRAQTTGRGTLADRAHAAQGTAAKLAASLSGLEHPYAKLMHQEYRFVCDSDPSYVAHEFLAPENHAYWRREFLELLTPFHIKYVTDADFNRESGRVPEGLAAQVAAAGLDGLPVADTIDLLSYRQLHSPVLAHEHQVHRPFTPDEFSPVFMASSLEPLFVDGPGPWKFVHASGHEVEVKERPLRDALCTLAPVWPGARRIETLLPDVVPWIDDLRLLHRYGTIELRLVEPPQVSGLDLNVFERRWGGYATNALHHPVD